MEKMMDRAAEKEARMLRIADEAFVTGTIDEHLENLRIDDGQTCLRISTHDIGGNRFPPQ